MRHRSMYFAWCLYSGLLSLFARKIIIHALDIKCVYLMRELSALDIIIIQWWENLVHQYFFVLCMDSFIIIILNFYLQKIKLCNESVFPFFWYSQFLKSSICTNSDVFCARHIDRLNDSLFLEVLDGLMCLDCIKMLL
jgi:hypothetical protein